MILNSDMLKTVYEAELLKIIDGDTLDMRVHLGLGFFCNARIRLRYIDAPEIYHTKKTDPEFIKGKIAKLHVSQWFYRDSYVYYLNAEHRDLYGRWIGEVWKKVCEGSLNDYLIDKYYRSEYKDWYHQEPLLSG